MIMTIMSRIQITQSNLLILFPMKNNPLKMKTTHLHILIRKRIYHPQLIFNQKHFTHTPHFRTNKINKKLIIPTQKTNLIFMTMITILIPEDTSMTDTISAHIHEKTIDFSSVKKNTFNILKSC